MVYKGVCINKGKTVEQDEAYVTALIDLLNNEELQKEFVEWYYSGNWVEEEEE